MWLHYYWRGLSNNVQHWCCTCVHCAMKKCPHAINKAPLLPIPVENAFERVGADCFGPFPVSKSSNQYIVVFSDYLTNWPEVFVGKVGTLRDLSQDPKKKLYISESLTQARKKLFGSINKFKKDNKWKCIWTNNGQIYLKQGDGENRTFTFNYADEFADFKSKFPLG